MTQPFMRSSAQIIKVVPQSQSENEIIRDPSVIPLGKPAFFLFGGEETTDMFKARFYGRYIRTILKQNNISGLDFYSVVYAFGSRIPSHDRAELFRAGKKNVIELEADNEKRAQQIAMVDKFEPKPIFIQILFEKIFKPRIVNQYGRRYDINTAVQYARNAICFTHCQGASTLLMIQNMIESEMNKVGYTQNEIDLFLKNIVAINHEPLGPINQFKMTTVSFMSVRDAVLRNNSMFGGTIVENAENIKPMYFDYQRTLVVPDVRDEVADPETDEHSTFDLGDKNPYKLSANGKTLFAAERNALVKAATAALEHKPIPKNLISGRGVKISELSQNASDFIAATYQSPQILVRDYQK